MVVGCSQNSLIGKEEVLEGGSFVSLDSNVDINTARDIALARIDLIQSTDEGQWENAEISDSFLWYNPMVTDGPAYLEFKITGNGKDQGYIMVSLTNLDFEIPEYHTEGKAMYEYLQSRAGTSDIKGIRFSPFSYAGEYTTRSGINRVYLGTLERLNEDAETRSDDNNYSYDSFMSNYILERNALGGIGGTKEELENHFKAIGESMKRSEYHITRGNPTPPYSATITGTIADWGTKLPTYDQFVVGSGKSGCSPTAATIVLAYWHLKHGKTGFFSRTPSINEAGMTSNERDVVLGLGNQSYMKTQYRDGFGFTGAYETWDGLWRYTTDHGYNHLIVRWYYVDPNSHEGSPQFPVSITNDWNNIYTELANNRPAILHYQETDGGHTAAIYSAKLYRDQWTGVVASVESSVVTGWGDVDTTSSRNRPPRKTVNTTSFVLNEVVTVKIY